MALYYLSWALESSTQDWFSHILLKFESNTEEKFVFINYKKTTCSWNKLSVTFWSQKAIISNSNLLFLIQPSTNDPTGTYLIRLFINL